MNMYDISRDLLNCEIYPGDPTPFIEPIRQMNCGDGVNLSAIYASLHTGTHVDAPYHYNYEGKTIEKMSLEHFIGPCYVLSAFGPINGEDVDRNISPSCSRLLIKGNGGAFLTPSGAFAISKLGIKLVGIDSTSISSEEDEAAVHKELLNSNIAILEGLNLSDVSNGKYFLFAPPVKISGADGAPARAVLLDL